MPIICAALRMVITRLGADRPTWLEVKAFAFSISRLWSGYSAALRVQVG